MNDPEKEQPEERIGRQVNRGGDRDRESENGIEIERGKEDEASRLDTNGGTCVNVQNVREMRLADN